MIAMGAALVGATFALARRYLPTGTALLVAGVVLTLPIILQQIADPYVEIPLARFTVLTLMAFLDIRRARAALFAAIAVWFKATGLMLVALVGLVGRSLCPGAMASVVFPVHVPQQLDGSRGGGHRHC